mgnify:CR=1 FL=1
MPFYTMPPTDLDEKITQSHIWVPMDDEHSWWFTVSPPGYRAAAGAP